MWSLRVAFLVRGRGRLGRELAATARLPLNFWRTVMPLNTRICESADVTRISDGFPGANYTANYTISS